MVGGGTSEGYENAGTIKLALTFTDQLGKTDCAQCPLVMSNF